MSATDVVPNIEHLQERRREAARIRAATRQHLEQLIVESNALLAKSADMIDHAESLIQKAHGDDLPLEL